MVVKAKARKGWLVAFIAIFFFLKTFSIIVYAEDTEVDSSVAIAKGNSAIAEIVTYGNSCVSKGVLKYDSKEGILYFINVKYSELNSEKKKKFMEKTLEKVKNTKLGTQQKNRVYNFIAEQDSATSAAIKYLKSDTSADLAEAKKWFEPFSSPISTFMGFVAILIFTFLTASILFDLAYLLLPGAQLILEHGDKEKRPFGVSSSAWTTLREVENSDYKSNCMSVYMKKRAPELFLVSLCLTYLVSGKIYDLVVFFLDAFDF